MEILQSRLQESGLDFFNSHEAVVQLMLLLLYLIQALSPLDFQVIKAFKSKFNVTLTLLDVLLPWSRWYLHNPGHDLRTFQRNYI